MITLNYNFVFVKEYNKYLWWKQHYRVFNERPAIAQVTKIFIHQLTSLRVDETTPHQQLS